MASANTPELPPGWTEHVKVSNGRKIKFYVGDGTDKKFYSKASVLRHIETEAGSPSGDIPQQNNEDNKQSPETTATPLVAETSESHDWLPHGWTIEMKTKRRSGENYKCYINNATGKKFYSKISVIRYIENEAESPCQSTPHQVGQDNETVLAAEVTPLAMQTPETLEWLPQGWITESKTKPSGKNYKCYVDPNTGRKFYSKPEVLKYLKSANQNSSSQLKKETESVSNPHMDSMDGDKLEVSQDRKELKGTSGTNQSNKTPDHGELGGETPILKSEDSQMLKGASTQKQTDLKKQPGIKVVIERVPADGLPPGWIKELRIEKKAKGSRKDPFYTDPVSGYVFRSQKDALRYLETGDITVCAIRPKKRKELGFFSEVASESLANDEKDGNANRIESEGSQHLDMNKGMSSADLSGQHSEKLTADNLDGGTSDVKSEDTQNCKKLKLTNGQVVIERSPADGLPPGWIKEVKIEKRASGIRRDPFYTDPVSGYVFRSQKDALRYLDTGDVKQCITKPRKREELHFLSDGALESSPPAADTEDLEHNIKRQLFGGKENGCKVSSGTATENPDSVCGEINGLTSPSPTTGGSKKTQGKKTVEDKKLTESDISKKQTSSSKSKRKNEVPLTRRSSKRFSGSNENESNPSPENEVLPEAIEAKTPPSETVMPNGSKKPSKGKQPVLEDPPLEQEAEKKDEEDTELKLHAFADSWSDPCLEFAIKTLTGTLSDVDNMEAEFSFPQELNTSAKVDSCLTLLDFTSPPTSGASAKPQFGGNPSPKPSTGFEHSSNWAPPKI